MPDAATLRRLAEERAGKRRGEPIHRPVPGDTPARSRSRTQTAPASAGPPLVLPVTLRIPWSMLISDNDKHVPNSPMLLTSEYRAAKKQIQGLARELVGEAAPLRQPLAFVAHVWVPAGFRGDTCNFSKLVHDALEHVLYANDRWLHRTTWERAGVDVDAPRADVTLHPYVGSFPDRGARRHG
jgi:hypothetical protein